MLIGALGGPTGVLDGQNADRPLTASVNALRFGGLGALIGMGASPPKVETVYRRIPLAETAPAKANTFRDRISFQVGLGGR